MSSWEKKEQGVVRIKCEYKGGGHYSNRVGDLIGIRIGRNFSMCMHGGEVIKGQYVSSHL